MKKIILIILYVVIACQFGHSQSLPEKCSAFCPSELNKSFIRQSSIEKLLLNNYGQSDTPTFCYWDAYSDRCDNEVYNGPSTSSGKSGRKLSFNQKVRIAEIKNRFAWVYIENKPGAVNYPQLSSDCEAVGWIPMDNLLLWSSCISNDFGINSKAFVLQNVGQQQSHTGGCFDQHPDKINPSIVSNVKKNNIFHYIMKKIDDRYLLATANTLRYTTDQKLEGWVSEKEIFCWYQNVYLEPNWDPETVQKLTNKFIYVYNSNGDVTSVFPVGRENYITDESASKYRLEPEIMRLPLIDDNDSNSYQYHILNFISSGMANIPGVHTHSFFLNSNKIDYPKECTLMAFHGYVEKKDSLTGLDYWKPVILLSSEELFELVKKLKQLKYAVKVSTYGYEERAKYVIAAASVIQCLTGLSSEYIEQLSSAEITDIIEGLNISTSFLKGQIGEKRYTMSDIKNPKICSDKDFKMIVKKMEDKIEDLEQILTSSYYKFSFIQNGVKYYWIPVEMLP